MAEENVFQNPLKFVSGKPYFSSVTHLTVVFVLLMKRCSFPSGQGISMLQMFLLNLKRVFNKWRLTLPLSPGEKKNAPVTSLEVMDAFHSTKFSKISDGNRMELSRKDFRKFKTTFSVFPKSGNFGIFENSRVPIKSFQWDCSPVSLRA